MTGTVIVTGYPRVHIALIDMINICAFGPGGVGFSIEGFPTVVEAKKASSFTIQGAEDFDSKTFSDFERIFKNLRKNFPENAADFLIKKHPKQHIGLGSKTTLCLSLVSAFSILQNTPLSQLEIQKLSGRGGLSGIGINTFFKGGLVIDVGRKRSKKWKAAPSGSQIANSLPVELMKLPMPESWKVVFAIDPNLFPFSGSTEETFFLKNATVPREEISNTLREVYHGLIPSVLDEDIVQFKDSLNLINRTGFKKREIGAYGSKIKCILNEINKLGFPAGMSSLGPLIFVIINETLEEKFGTLVTNFEKNKLKSWKPMKFRNEGFNSKITN